MANATTSDPASSSSRRRTRPARTAKHQAHHVSNDDMHGRVVLVTGANSGVGFAVSAELAAAGAAIKMVCRDRRRGEQAQALVAQVASGPEPELLIADLSSQAEIRALAQEVRARVDRIDVLLNNAGGVFAKRELSVDGIELTLATNHLAPFLLTNLLLDLVRAAPAARVVTVATEVYGKRLDFANLQGERHYQFFKAYQRSKLANILFAFELARRLEGTGATSNAVSPGPTRTRFGDNMGGVAGLFPKIMKRLPIFGSPEDGARTLVYAAAAPELVGITGRFFFKSREIQTKPVTRDQDVAAHLWSVSEQLAGLAPAAAHASARSRVS
jgi:NAD(P)-dependent dehydrogenase (short-subunit alcohol dehydrogenase family)